MEEQGYERNLVVLTRPANYVKTGNPLMPMIERGLRDYPEGVEAIRNRHIAYNEEVAYVRQREIGKYAFVIRPDRDLDIGRVEHDRTKIRAAYKDGEAKLRGTGRSVPALESIKTPLRDGDIDRPDDEAYAGCWFINANCTQEPGLVDAHKQDITEPSQLYSGCYGRASINFYAYNTNGNKGIACGLNGLQKLRDGEPLGGRGNVSNDFDVETDDDDDDDNFLD